MHRSRISTVLIDTPEADEAVAFWSGALGVPAKPAVGEEHFKVLEGALPGLVTVVQRIEEGEPRIHVDMETDDLDAETARLIALGATELSRWLDCRTLRVPGGHIVCVIPVHSDRAEFEAAATIWE
ncbi:VOC family protein [Glycomyces rhizosphaerae]|uniref:VOC family protein n=1 Tax=Glycomyces rhizosphaerae TaxID=2054422 RepID=A0ABV7PZY1_9ACTN